jgi:catechol 2,3-dioxygenase-like lactoylglutathione lyase family enzyme
MLEFYGKVLALRSLSPITLGGGAQMVLYGVGSGQVKLSAGQPASRQYKAGKVNEVTGLRVITLFFPDEAALVARFRESGYPVPAFRDGHGGTRVAMVPDPAGHMTELVVLPNAPPGSLDRMEVGITVSDLEKSRAFYREFVGLDELPPVQDVLLGVTKYPYRHGQTTVNLWTFGKGLQADTGSAGIQYVVSDVDTVDARAKARQVTVETPLGDMRGFTGLRTVWLNDPDGVTNYFAQTTQSARAR